jgi:hypothetical protein
MYKQGIILYRTLIIGVGLLFIGIAVEPCISSIIEPFSKIGCNNSNFKRYNEISESLEINFDTVESCWFNRIIFLKIIVENLMDRDMVNIKWELEFEPLYGFGKIIHPSGTLNGSLEKLYPNDKFIIRTRYFGLSIVWTRLHVTYNLDNRQEIYWLFLIWIFGPFIIRVEKKFP